MILALDIGNSRMKAGREWNGSLEVSATGTRPFATAASYIELLGIEGVFERVIVASVVDELHETVREIALKVSGKEPIMVNNTLNTGIFLEAQNSSTVGADRIANAVGGYHLVNAPAIVVDFGTATTMRVAVTRLVT